MKKNINELDILDSEDLIEKIEAEAALIEGNFIKNYNDERSEKVPVFDFEIN